MKRFITILLILVFAGSIAYWLLPKLNHNTVAIYYFKGSHLQKVERNVGAGNVNPERAVRELLLGPSINKLRGYFTEIPMGTKLINLDVEDGIAYVNFSSRLATYGGGASRVRGLIAQIVYTLTEFSEVKKVKFLINGRSDAALGPEGFDISEPFTRGDVSFN